MQPSWECSCVGGRLDPYLNMSFGSEHPMPLSTRLKVALMKLRLPYCRQKRVVTDRALQHALLLGCGVFERDTLEVMTAVR
eukprot:768690-Hanusia_phi.AAC.1